MKKLCYLFLIVLPLAFSCKTQFIASGPQGRIATTMRLPEGFNPATDTVQMVILMHGIFSSKDYPPMPRIGSELAKAGIASIAIDFGGHGKSQGKKVNMTIGRELAEARAVYEYVQALPYVTRISFLGHSQGGVIASMLAGELAKEGACEAGDGAGAAGRAADRAPLNKLILLAPGAVIKEACQGGHFFRNTFDPQNPPKFIRCFGFYKVGREYLVTSQQLDIYGTTTNFQGPVCIIHGTKDGIVPLWCSEKYHETYANSSLHLIEGENHLMVSHLSETIGIIKEFLGE